MQTPKEFTDAVSAVEVAIELPVINVIAELERAEAGPAAKAERLFKDFLPQIIAITFIALILGASIGVAIGKHVSP